MKYKEIKNLDAVELRKKLKQLKQEAFDAKMKLSMKRLPNPLTIRFLRKDQARIMTALQNVKTTSNKKVNK